MNKAAILTCRELALRPVHAERRKSLSWTPNPGGEPDTWAGKSSVSAGLMALPRCDTWPHAVKTPIRGTERQRRWYGLCVL